MTHWTHSPSPLPMRTNFIVALFTVSEGTLWHTAFGHGTVYKTLSINWPVSHLQPFSIRRLELELELELEKKSADFACKGGIIAGGTCKSAKYTPLLLIGLDLI